MNRSAGLWKTKLLSSQSLKKAPLISILIAIIFAFSAANTVHAVEVTATIPLNAGTIAYDSGKGEIWATIFVPYVNEMGMHVSMSNSVSALSDSNNKVAANVTVGDDPSSIAFDSGKSEIFVTNQNSGTVSVISDSTNVVVATINLNGNPNYGGPTNIVYDSGKGEIFVDDYFSGVISVISDSTNKVVATLSLGNNPGPSGLIYDSGKGELFVGYEQSVGGNPANFMSVISDSNNSVVATVHLDNNIAFGAYDFAKSEIFVADPGNNTVSVISDKTNVVIANVPVGNAPTGVAYDSIKGLIFVANSADNTTSVISDKTNGVVANVPVGNGPIHLVYDPRKGEIFILNSASSSISILSDSSLLSASESPTVPEFGNASLILMFLFSAFSVVAFVTKISTRTHSHSK